MEHTKIYHQTEIEVPGSEEALLGGGEKAKNRGGRKGDGLQDWLGSIFGVSGFGDCKRWRVREAIFDGKDFKLFYFLSWLRMNIETQMRRVYKLTRKSTAIGYEIILMLKVISSVKL